MLSLSKDWFGPVLFDGFYIGVCPCNKGAQLFYSSSFPHLKWPQLSHKQRCINPGLSRSKMIKWLETAKTLEFHPGTSVFLKQISFLLLLCVHFVRVRVHMCESVCKNRD